MNLRDLEERARARLPKPSYDYFAGGAENEVTLAENPAAWDRIRLRPRTLRVLGEIDTSSSVLGVSVDAPVLVAPMGMQRLADPDGDVAVARAAAAAGTVAVVPMMGTTRPEDVAAASPATKAWLQVYLLRDRGRMREIVAAGVEAGFRAIVFTVDTIRQGLRTRDIRNEFALPEGITIPNAVVPVGAGAEQGASVAVQFDPAIGPGDIGWLREISGLPVVVKGVLRGDDAAEFVEAGASAIVVSNHGGRQLDTVTATADALPEVVRAVGSGAEVYVDGGIRCGADVVKALALGARAVLVGRPVIWGLATGGEAGAATVLQWLRDDLERVMALCGTATVDAVEGHLVLSGGAPGGATG